MPSCATSGAVPLWIAFSTATSSFPGTVFTVIHGYFFSKSEITVLNSLNSGLVKNVQSVIVTGACDALGLMVGVVVGVVVPPPAVHATATMAIVAAIASNAFLNFMPNL